MESVKHLQKKQKSTENPHMSFSLLQHFSTHDQSFLLCSAPFPLDILKQILDIV